MHDEPLDTAVSETINGTEEPFYPTIRQLRHALGLTQRKLAERAGLDESTIRKAEKTADRTKAISTDTLRMIAYALNVPTDRLYLGALKVTIYGGHPGARWTSTAGVRATNRCPDCNLERHRSKCNDPDCTSNQKPGGD